LEFDIVDPFIIMMGIHHDRENARVRLDIQTRLFPFAAAKEKRPRVVVFVLSVAVPKILLGASGAQGQR
jgi:hypothetical protein